MIHLLLNSGKAHQNTRPQLLPLAEHAMLPFLKAGRGSFPAPFDAYSIEIVTAPTGLAFTFFKGKDAISVSVGTWEAETSDEYWNQIEEEYDDVSREFPQFFWSLQTPKMPETVPWLATLLLPHYFIETASDNEAISFFNSCEVVLFWASESLARGANGNN